MKLSIGDVCVYRIGEEPRYGYSLIGEPRRAALHAFRDDPGGACLVFQFVAWNPFRNVTHADVNWETL